ncbi:MAG: cupin domain-containing protein [Burkholderiaceae bacterium]
MNDNTMQLHRARAGTSDNWSDRARYFNSGNAFAMSLPAVPSVQFTDERNAAFDPDGPTGLIDMNLSHVLQTPFAATTPFAMSRYMRIRAGESLCPNLVASAQVICILKGAGHTTGSANTGESASNSGSTRWAAGDVMLLPCTELFTHVATEETVAWLVTDEPTLSFLGLNASDYQRIPVQQPVHYLAQDLDRELDAVYAHPDVKQFAGYAVVLSHDRMEQSRNIHPTLTLALNSLPPESAQRPHRHNSMALTMCIDGKDCYSTIDGQRKDWEDFAVMVTPPGAMHSHHNAGSQRMRCLIVQDGALYYHGRTMGFSFD